MSHNAPIIQHTYLYHIIFKQDFYENINKGHKKTSDKVELTSEGWTTETGDVVSILHTPAIIVTRLAVT